MMKNCDYRAEFFSYGYDETEITVETEFPFHAHEQYEIYWFVGGAGVYFIEGSEYKLKPNMILLMRSAEMHRPKLKIGSMYKRATVHFSPQYIAGNDPEFKFLLPFTNHSPGVENMYCKEDFDSNLIYDCLANMSKINGDKYADKLRLDSMFYCVLQELYDAHTKRCDVKNAAEDTLMSQITLYIEQHLSEQLSLAELQNRFYISKTHLTRLFKKTTGLSAWEYIGVKRLTVAKTMLGEGGRATVVAQKCGFSDYSAFYRAYKKRFGVAPSSSRP